VHLGYRHLLMLPTMIKSKSKLFLAPPLMIHHSPMVKCPSLVTTSMLTMSILTRASSLAPSLFGSITTCTIRARPWLNVIFLRLAGHPFWIICISVPLIVSPTTRPRAAKHPQCVSTMRDVTSLLSMPGTMLCSLLRTK